MKRVERTLAVIGASALLFVGSTVATQAGNGKSILLGKLNKGTKTTVVKMTSGSASPLSLQGNASSAPLITNMTGQVANLNASMVGGASLTTVAFTDSVARTADKDYLFSIPDAGNYLVSLYANVEVNGTATPAAPIQFTCYVYDGDGNIVIEAMTLDVGEIWWPTLSASRVWNVSASSTDARNMHLYCKTTANQGWNPQVPEGAGPTVSFTRLPSVATTSLTPQ